MLYNKMTKDSLPVHYADIVTREGAEAYRAGTSYLACPYDKRKDAGRCFWWHQGWHTAFVNATMGG